MEWAESNRQEILEEKIRKAQISSSPRKVPKSKIFHGKALQDDGASLQNPRSQRSSDLSSGETDLGRFESIENLQGLDMTDEKDQGERPSIQEQDLLIQTPAAGKLDESESDSFSNNTRIDGADLTSNLDGEYDRCPENLRTPRDPLKISDSREQYEEALWQTDLKRIKAEKDLKRSPLPRISEAQSHYERGSFSNCSHITSIKLGSAILSSSAKRSSTKALLNQLTASIPQNHSAQAKTSNLETVLGPRSKLSSFFSK